MCFPQRCLDSAPCLVCDSFEEFEVFVHKYSPRLWIRDWLFSTHAYVKQNKEEKIFFFFLTKFLRRYRCLSAGPGPEASIMSRFMELREFGDAATFLRKTNLEQLAAQSHAFDGTVRRPVCVLCENEFFYYYYWCRILSKFKSLILNPIQVLCMWKRIDILT